MPFALRISVLASFALLLFSLPSATASIKAGSNCKNIGQIIVRESITFECTKSGSKRIWVAKSQPKAEQTALGSPIAMSAFNEMQKVVLKMGTSISPNIRTIPSPNTDSKLEKEIQRNLIFASEYFKDYLPQNLPITAWIVGSPQDGAWSAASWRVAIPYQAENLIARQDGFSAQVGNTADGAFAIIITSPDQLTTFHEFTHAVQDQVAQGKAGLPCWVREGMAEYESNAMMGRNSEVAYKTAMINLIQELSMISIAGFKYRSVGADYWVNYFMGDETRNNGECRKSSSLLDPAYSAGGLGFQYLQGKYGREKTFEFIKNIGVDWKGVCNSPNEKMIPCKSWKLSFRNTFGIEPTVAYKAMGAFITNQIAWSFSTKSLPESDIKNLYPESRTIPEYAPLINSDVAGAPCFIAGTTSGNLKCQNKDGFLFWVAMNNSNGPSNFGGQPQPKIDDLGAPPGVPAPGRTCPNIGDRVRYEKTPLVCEAGAGKEGIWIIDKNPQN
jgi:hypothetical protein